MLAMQSDGPSDSCMVHAGCVTPRTLHIVKLRVPMQYSISSIIWMLRCTNLLAQTVELLQLLSTSAGKALANVFEFT